MAEKKDFMSELAKSVEANKRGEQTTMLGIDEFEPRARQASNETDYDSFPQAQNTNALPKVEATQPIEEVEIPQAVQQETPVFVMPEEAPTETMSTRPASFSQESFQKIEKPKRSIPWWVWLLLLLGLLLLGGLIWYFLFAPKIVVPDCVGEDISCVTNWAKQSRMESSSLVRNEEYSLDYGENVVIDQSVEPGKKIKPTTPFTVTVSLGPDPEESIAFPSDIRTMTQEEIREWISENQLLKTKITTQYSDTVEEGHVISYEVRNGSEDGFTRGTTLNVITSKGPAPAGQVTVDNLAGKTIGEVEQWAKQKKVVLNEVETYDNKVESGHIISSSVPQGQTIREGDTITVTVSKGKGVRIPNLVGYTKEQFEAWKANKDNTVVVVPKSIYNNQAEGTVIQQSIAPGTIVEAGTVLEVTESLYLPILQTNSRQWLGVDYLQLKAQVDEFNSKGANIQAGEYGALAQRVCSDEFPTPGSIVSYVCEGGTVDSDGDTHYSAGCERPLNLNSRISYQVSTGPCTVAPPTPVPTAAPTTVVLTDGELNDLSNLINWCNANGIGYYELTAVERDSRDGEWSSTEHESSNIRVTYNGQRYYSTPPFTIVMNVGDSIGIEYVTNPPTPTPEG